MILVTDYPTSEKIEKDFDVVIGMLDPCFKDRQFFNPNRHMFFFEDAVEQNHLGTRELPMRHHIADIMTLVKQHKHSNILVHCAAGSSRSTAVAIGILVMFGATPEEAIDIIHNQRGDRMWPNERIIALFDLELGQPDLISEPLRKWKARQPRLTWM